MAKTGLAWAASPLWPPTGSNTIAIAVVVSTGLGVALTGAAAGSLVIIEKAASRWTRATSLFSLITTAPVAIPIVLTPATHFQIVWPVIAGTLASGFGLGGFWASRRQPYS